MNLDSFWTDQRKAELQRRWLSGQSSGFIAADWRVSRNTIAGQVHRLGLKRGQAAKPIKQQPYPKRASKPSTNPPAKPKGRRYVANSDDPVVTGHPITLMALRSNSCRWPVTQTRAGDWLFCGDLVDDGCVYCAGHRRIAYAPSRVRAA